MAEQGRGQISKVTYKHFLEGAPDQRYNLTRTLLPLCSGELPKELLIQSNSSLYQNSIDSAAQRCAASELGKGSELIFACNIGHQ